MAQKVISEARGGTISGERSFAANSRERGRTRANPRELRPRSPTVRQLFYFANCANVRPRSPNVRRTFGELLANSPEFARIRAESAANWRTVRQKMSPTPTGFIYTANDRRTANDRSPRTSSPGVRRERVCRSANLSPPSSNDRSPRTIVRRELESAIRERSFAAANDRSRWRTMANDGGLGLILTLTLIVGRERLGLGLGLGLTLTLTVRRERGRTSTI